MRRLLLLSIMLFATPSFAQTWRTPSLIFASKLLIGDLSGARAMIVGPIRQIDDARVFRDKMQVDATELFRYLQTCRMVGVTDESVRNLATQSEKPAVDVSFSCRGQEVRFSLTDVGQKVSIYDLRLLSAPTPVMIRPANG